MVSKLHNPVQKRNNGPPGTLPRLRLLNTGMGGKLFIDPSLVCYDLQHNLSGKIYVLIKQILPGEGRLYTSTLIRDQYICILPFTYISLL